MSTEPRTWSIPPEPEDVERLRDRDGQIWRRVDPNDWTLQDAPGSFYSWVDLLHRRGPLTEVVETEVEVAARYFRDNLATIDDGLPGAVMHEQEQRLAILLIRHVLNGGTL